MYHNKAFKRTAEQIPAVFLKFYPLYKSGQMTATEFARASNIGRTTLYKYLRIVEAGWPLASAF